VGLRKLVGLFYDMESQTEAEAPVAAETPEAPVSTPKVTKAAQASVAGVDPSVIASLDKAAQDQLIEAMEASGARLVEELESLIDTLRETIENEPSLYKAAIKVIMKRGPTLIDIQQDFDKCIGAVESKSREFEAQLTAELNKRVGVKSKMVDECKSQIASKQAQISKLESEVAELAARSHEAQQGISAEQQKLDLARSRFNTVYNTIRTGIKTHCDKVMKYGAL